MPKINKLPLALSIGLIAFLAIDVFARLSAAGPINIARFSMMELNDWQNKSFAGETQYILKDDEQNSYLQAESKQTASALYKKIKVDITETPYLNWSWRIDYALPQLNERQKNGDDYAARIYVVFKTGITPLSAKALNYVWSSNETINTSWPNAFTDKAIMIPLRSSEDQAHQWQYEKVNVKKDLIQFFGSAPKYINGVAIMTDTDNSKGVASASYGDIYFTSD